MNISADGIAFIKSNEGLKLSPYKDEDGYSVGYGHFLTLDEMRTWTALGRFPLSEERATAILMQDLKTVEEGIGQLVHVALTQNQYDALCDFCFNEGVGALASSTLLKDLNDGHYQMAAAQLPEWDYAGGQVNSSLYSRRLREQKLFLA